MTLTSFQDKLALLECWLSSLVATLSSADNLSKADLYVKQIVEKVHFEKSKQRTKKHK